MKIYDEYVIRLMEAYLTGKLDDAGRKELEAWCGACEKNRKFFERVCREDRIAREVPLYAEVDGEKAFRHFQKRIRGRKWLRRLVRCAAVLLLPLGVVAVWQWMGMEVHRDTGQEIVPGTSRAVLTLAGGEQVCLQEGKPVEKRLEAMEVEQKEGVLSYQTVRPVQENAEDILADAKDINEAGYRPGRGIPIGVVGRNPGFFECGNLIEVSGGVRRRGTAGGIGRGGLF